MRTKIGLIFLSVSIFFAILYGVDKMTSDNPSNGALLRIGLSDTDSSICKVCEEGEMYYESGCKRCIQDGVVMTAHVSNERFYSIGWSNDNGMYYGDNNCDGKKKTQNVFANENNTYYIEMSKNDLSFQTNFYKDENFSDLEESVEIQMCSNPSNLQYIRITNEDGKPSGNGGKLSGSIDDIQIFKEIDNQMIPTFSTSFDECIDKTCSDVWTLHNSDHIFINDENNSLSFLSRVTGTHDYAHLKLNDELPNSWLMKFKFHIEDLDEHPRGKGILNIDPELRQIFLGLPALIFPFIGYVITLNQKSSHIGIMLLSIGIIILSGILFNFYQINSSIDGYESEKIYEFLTIQNFGILTISVLIIILGITRIKSFMKKDFPK